MDRNHRLHGCVVEWMQVKRVTGKDQLCIMVTHPDFNKDGLPIKLHAVKGHWRIHQEGEPDLFFDSVPRVAVNEQEEQFALPPETADPEATESMILEALLDVVEIDNNNQPLPENIPTSEDSPGGVLSDQWGHNGICFWKQAEMRKSKARLLFHVDRNDEFHLLKLFDGLFPKSYIETVLIPETNNKLEGRPLTYGELLRWIGMWVIMSTVDGASQRSFWSLKKLDIFDGAPFRLQEYMSRNRFEAILGALTYTNLPPPAFRDRFWEVR
jgi:hypothetical protein